MNCPTGIRLRSRRRAGFTFTDLLTSIGIVVFLCAAVMAGPVGQLRERANRQKCMQNLRGIAMACQLYANSEVRNGAFPRTIYNPKSDQLILDNTGHAVDDSFDPKNVGENNVPASFFMVLKTQDITPEQFICPSSNGEAGFGKGERVTVQESSNWKEIPGNVTYSYACPFASEKALKQGWKFNNAREADYPLAADLNPGEPALTKLTPASSAEAMRRGNSLNHSGDGQNVVYCDGHAEFQTTPFCGLPLAPNARTGPRDNIYTYGAVTDKQGGDGIIGMPDSAIDAVLLPTSFKPAPATQPAAGAATQKSP